jgi:hypothetical protein
MYTPPELVYNIVEYTSFACVYFSMAVPIKNGPHIVEASAVWMASILKWGRNSSGSATAFLPPSPYRERISRKGNR